MSLMTKHALAESFKKLLAKRSFDKITVKDLVQDCGVNRQTFYYYFHDIYELMEWILQDTADALLRKEVDYGDWTAAVETLMEYLQKERLLVLNAYHSISHEAVADYLKRLMRPYVLGIVQTQAKELELPALEENVAFVTDIYTLTAAGIVMEWIGQQMRMNDTENRLHKLYLAMNGSILLMLRNLEENQT